MAIFRSMLVSLLILAHTATYARMIPPGFHQKSTSVLSSVLVDQAGSGNFTTIQAAIDWVTPKNKQWVRIHVKPASYKEKLTIPKDKQFIYLEGEGEAASVIQWDDSGNSRVSSTFTVEADNFLASRITFENTHDLGIKGPHSFTVAPAIVLSGDKAAFYNCRFRSLQDTLGDLKGRHYFESCYIEGAVDFIWGGGQSQYANCKINSTAANLAPGNVTGFIAAQGRTEENDTSAFVFVKGSVDGEGQTYLGRAYRAYSTVIFSQTDFGNIIVPKGWDAWNYAGHEKPITFVESQCTGPGSNTSGRVSWMKTLSSDNMDKYLDRAKFIDHDGWIGAQPQHN